MKFILTACLCFIAITFNNCSICSCKKVPCPGFNDVQFTSWFPYTANQEIIFKNAGSYDTITIGSIDNSNAYDARQGCYNPDHGCYMNSFISSSQLTGNGYKFSLVYHTVTPFESGSTTKEITFQLYGFNVRGSEINDQGVQMIFPAFYSSQYFPSITVGGSVFNNVQLIKKDTADGNYAGPYKIYVAKNTGLVAYENYPDLKTWVKQ